MSCQKSISYIRSSQDGHPKQLLRKSKRYLLHLYRTLMDPSEQWLWTWCSFSWGNRSRLFFVLFCFAFLHYNCALNLVEKKGFQKHFDIIASICQCGFMSWFGSQQYMYFSEIFVSSKGLQQHRQLFPTHNILFQSAGMKYYKNLN